MKKIIVIAALLFLFFYGHAQDYKILLQTPDLKTIAEISKLVSIDHINKDSIVAFANQEEYNNFKSLNIKHSVISLDFKKQNKSKSTDNFVAQNQEDLKNYTKYPSYQLYLQIMEDFAKQNSDICKLVTIGQSVEGRQILALKISDNVDIDEASEPEFFYSSSMHGDEICGYVLMLKLIDYIIKNYNNNTQIYNLVNNAQIYINPLANPDGTYAGGDDNVSNSTRYNANNIDLNRNFPTIDKTLAKQSLQPETQAMIDFAQNHRFSLSANLHGGDEVLNYPWDSFYNYELPLPDEDFFVEICQNYIDTARAIDPTYMKTVSENGYIFGSEWYKVTGGRQDYMNFYHRCKEITIELSRQKVLDTAKIENYWQKNKQSLINFASQCLQGVKGKVTDIYGKELEASIIIGCADNEYSHTFSRDSGFYFRPLPQGKSFLIYAVADGYQTDSATITTIKDSLITLNFCLQPGQSDEPICAANEIQKDLTEFSTFFSNGKITIKSPTIINNCQLITTDGKIVYQISPQKENFDIPVYNLKTGIYIVRALCGEKKYTRKIFVK